jgi:hypothetical protein
MVLPADGDLLAVALVLKAHVLQDELVDALLRGQFALVHDYNCNIGEDWRPFIINSASAL